MTVFEPLTSGMRSSSCAEATSLVRMPLVQT